MSVLRRGLMVCLSVVALALVGWTLVTRPEARQLEHVHDLLSRLGDLERGRGGAVLGVRFGLQRHYDGLGHDMDRARALAAELTGALPAPAPLNAPDLARMASAYASSLDEVAELLADFSSENATLVNSRRFLAKAAADARAHLSDDSGGAASVELLVERLLQHVSCAGDHTVDRAQEALEAVADLPHVCDSKPCPRDLLTRHASLSLSHGAAVDGLLRALAEPPSAGPLDQMAHSFEQWRQELSERTHLVLVVLAACCAWLGLELVASLLRLSRSAQALRQANQRLDAQRADVDEVVSRLAEPLLLLSSSGRVRRANAEAARWLGLGQPEALRGRRLASLAAIPESFDALLREVADGGDTRDRFVDFLHSDGDFLPASISLTRLDPSGGGRRQGLVCVAHDRRAELAVREAAERLRVSEARTREAEQASVAKSRFLATMSHELRTPLNGVLGMAELLADGPLDAAQELCLDLLRQSADALLELLDDILRVVQLDAGAEVPSLLVTDVRRLVTETLECHREAAARRGLSLHQALEAAVPTTAALDPGLLRDVLGRLLDNAIRFTDAGQVSLVVSLEENEHESSLRFAVCDTGPGIAPDQLARCFEPFTQGDESDTRRHGGTGLGLSLSRRLVSRMGGVLEADSALGQGSTFWFRLPLGGVAQADDPVRGRQLVESTEAAQSVAQG